MKLSPNIHPCPSSLFRLLLNNYTLVHLTQVRRESINLPYTLDSSLLSFRYNLPYVNYGISLFGTRNKRGPIILSTSLRRGSVSPSQKSRTLMLTTVKVVLDFFVHYKTGNYLSKVLVVGRWHLPIERLKTFLITRTLICSSLSFKVTLWILK